MASIWDTPVGTQPGAGSNNIFWNQGSTYGGGQSYWDTPISETIREQNLPIAFSSFLNRQGIGDNDTAFNRWAYSQFPRFERAYGMATMENPFITIDQFLATLPTQEGLRQQFLNTLSPQARGLTPSQTNPIARWIGR